MVNLSKDPIPKLIAGLAVPMSIGFAFNTMFNVVDTFYAGLISTEALAALGLSFPVFFIIIAMGSGIGTGTTALMSNAFGQKKKSLAKLYAVQSLTFTLILSVILSVVGMLAAPSLFRTLGASEQYLSLSLDYMNIILTGTFAFLLTFVFNAMLNAQGDTKSFRNFLIIGFFANLVLDPALIYGWLFLPKLGLAGVAYATILIELFGSVYLGYKVYRTGLFDSLRKNLKIKLQIYRDIAAQGFPAGLNMMTVALGIFIITYYLSQFGKEAVAAYGTATRIEQIILLPTIGLNVATLAIVGHNNGAKKYARIKEAIRQSLKYGLAIMTLGTILLLIFARQMMDIFTDDATVIGFGAQYLRIAAFITWAYVLLYVNVSGLQGMKKPMFALYMGLYRQVLAPVVIFTFLTPLFGIAGVWWGIFATVWSGALITVIYSKRVLGRLSEPKSSS